VCSYPNDLDIDPWSEEGTVYFSDSGSIPPALCAEGYYDTLWSYILTSFQVYSP